MLRLRLCSMTGVSSMRSSSSSLTLKNPSLPISSNPKLFNGVFFNNRVTLSSRFSNASLRCFAASATATVDKVRVQNPIVEMDGNSNSKNIWFLWEVSKMSLWCGTYFYEEMLPTSTSLDSIFNFLQKVFVHCKMNVYFLALNAEYN